MSENSTNSKSWHDSYGVLAKREEEPVAFGAPRTKKTHLHSTQTQETVKMIEQKTMLLPVSKCSINFSFSQIIVL